MSFRRILKSLGLSKKGEKRDNWFTHYQSIPQLGIKGKRDAQERLAFYQQADFQGASALDVGCNRGQMCFQAKEWGADRVVGVEYDHTAFSEARKFNEQIGSDINFIFDDIDNPFFWNSIGQFDVTMFLSVIDTKELTNRFGILAKICRKTNNVMYLEGHTGADTEPSRYFRHIIDYTDFTQIVYCGDTKDRDRKRPFFRCTRETLSSEECVNQLKNSSHNRIAVIGRGYAGKTFIRQQLEEQGGVEGYTIIDDLRINQGKSDETRISAGDLQGLEKFILFDYRALEYIDNFDVVYFVTPAENRISEKHKDSRPDLRSPQGSMAHVKEMYTVVSRQ